MAHSQSCHVAGRHSWMGNLTGGLHISLQSVRSTSGSALFLELPQFYRPLNFDGQDPVHRMQKCIYSQVNSSRLFYEHLCNGMAAIGFEPSQSDPCLFIHKVHKIMVNYCDDQIWMSPDNALIEEHVKKLQDLKYDLALEAEGDMFDFLGINFAKDGDKIVLTQTGLIDKVISYTGMDHTSVQHTPAACFPLGSDKDGEPFDETWSYRSAVSMLLYVCSQHAARPPVCSPSSVPIRPQPQEVTWTSSQANHPIFGEDSGPRTGICAQPGRRLGLLCRR